MIFIILFFVQTSLNFHRSQFNCPYNFSEFGHAWKNRKIYRCVSMKNAYDILYLSIIIRWHEIYSLKSILKIYYISYININWQCGLYWRYFWIRETIKFIFEYGTNEKLSQKFIWNISKWIRNIKTKTDLFRFKPILFSVNQIFAVSRIKESLHGSFNDELLLCEQRHIWANVTF